MRPKPPNELNPICLNCYGKCKQAASAQILFCPHYEPYPVQLELKLPGLKKTYKKRKKG